MQFGCTNTDVPSGCFAHMVSDLLQMLLNFRLDGAISAMHTFTSPTTYVMGLCVLSNLLASCTVLSTWLSSEPTDSSAVVRITTVSQLADIILEICMKAMNYSVIATAGEKTGNNTQEINLMGSTVLFNFAMIMSNRGAVGHGWGCVGMESTGDIHSNVVQILCSVLEQFDGHSTTHYDNQSNVLGAARKLSALYLILHSHAADASAASSSSGVFNQFADLILDLEVKGKCEQLQGEFRRMCLTQLSVVNSKAAVQRGLLDAYILLCEILKYV
jgi:hypothetical protein